MTKEVAEQSTLLEYITFGDINQYFTEEELRKIKSFESLSKKDEEYLHVLSNAIIDRLEEEIVAGRLKLPKK